MEEGNSENENSGKRSTKRLVRILVIVGIGIPVLVELLTLFNLINVQLFSGEEEQAERVQATEEVQKYATGDTLYADLPVPIIISSMKIKVSTQHWHLDLALIPADTSAINDDIIRIDSIGLKSGKVLTPEQALGIESDRDEPGIYSEWELPSGDIPQMLYLSSNQPFGPDSTRVIQKELRLGNIPIRYEREQ